jgi:hypothetical protein
MSDQLRPYPRRPSFRASSNQYTLLAVFTAMGVTIFTGPLERRASTSLFCVAAMVVQIDYALANCSRSVSFSRPGVDVV